METHDGYTSLQKRFVHEVFECEAVVALRKRGDPSVVTRHNASGEVEIGYWTAQQDEDPTRQLPPFKINLHPPSADKKRSGPLTKEAIAAAAECVKERLKRIDAKWWKAVAGVPYSGQPFAKAVADSTDKKLVELWKIQKDGRQTTLQDRLPAGTRKIVLIDNETRPGNSLLDSLTVLQASKADIVAAVTIIDHEEGATGRITEWGCPYYSIFTVRELFKCAMFERIITFETCRLIHDYLDAETKRRERIEEVEMLEEVRAKQGVKKKE